MQQIALAMSHVPCFAWHTKSHHDPFPPHGNWNHASKQNVTNHGLNFHLPGYVHVPKIQGGHLTTLSITWVRPCILEFLVFIFYQNVGFQITIFNQTFMLEKQEWSWYCKPNNCRKHYLILQSQVIWKFACVDNGSITYAISRCYTACKRHFFLSQNSD